MNTFASWIAILPLGDVEVRLDADDGVVAVRSARLALGWLEPGGLQPLPLTADGWWRSGGAAVWRGGSPLGIMPGGPAAIGGPLAARRTPRTWWPCPELAPSEVGKWQRGRWRDWLGGR